MYVLAVDESALTPVGNGMVMSQKDSMALPSGAHTASMKLEVLPPDQPSSVVALSKAFPVTVEPW